MQEKINLRKEIRQLKRQFTQAQLDELSLGIVRNILNNEHIKKAQTVLLYYSLNDEVNTHRLVDILLNQGKTVLLPFIKNDEEMEMREYHGFQDLRTGAYNIMEPIGNTYTKIGNIDTALIPGMSFDANLNRLGRGKGYYDRFLKKIPQAYIIGVCFDFQKQEQIPTGKFDVKMDEII